MYYVYDGSKRIDSFNRIFIELYAVHDNNGYAEHIVMMSDPAGQSLHYMEDILRKISEGAVVKIEESDIGFENIGGKACVDMIMSYTDASEADIVSMLTKAQEMPQGDLYVVVAKISLKDILGVRFGGSAMYMDARLNVNGEYIRVRKLDPYTRPGSMVLINLAYLYMDVANIAREREKISRDLEAIIDEMLGMETAAVITFAGQYSVKYRQSTYTPVAAWIYFRVFDDIIERLEKYSESKQVVKLIKRYRGITRSQKKITQLEAMFARHQAVEEKQGVKID